MIRVGKYGSVHGLKAIRLYLTNPLQHPDNRPVTNSGADGWIGADEQGLLRRLADGHHRGMSEAARD